MLLRWITYVVVLIFIPGEKCYGIGGAVVNRNWNESVDYCNSLGANLASVESKEENDFLIALLLMMTKNSAWIGLNDQEEEGNYKWQSGSTSLYRNWRSNEPSGESNKDEDCVQLLVDLFSDSVGEWNDNSCDYSIGYICEKKSDLKQKFPNLRYCTYAEGGGFRFHGSCYHLVTVMKSWEEAEQHCVDNYGGHLITVLDKSVDLFLQYLLQSIQADVWIGIKIRDQYQQKWSSGWYVGYNGFSKEHRDFIKGSCVVRSQLKKWNIVPCEKKFSFICEKSDEKIPTLKPPVEGSHCPSVPHDWRDLDGERCYFIETENTVTWYEANFQCMRRGGHLLSLHSEEEGDILHPFIKYTGHAAFIGLFRQYERENTFRWTDGSALDFVNWRHWEPSNENEKCVEAQTSDMEWNDVFCNDTKAYICTIKKIIPNLTAISMEKPESSCECSVTPSSTTASNVTCESDGNNSGALIGVIISIVINIILIGVVIYYCRKKTSSDVIGLQPCVIEVPRRTFKPAQMEEDTYYEPMDG